jgi:hypothetical protein
MPAERVVARPRAAERHARQIDFIRRRRRRVLVVREERQPLGGAAIDRDVGVLVVAVERVDRGVATDIAAIVRSEHGALAPELQRAARIDREVGVARRTPILADRRRHDDVRVVGGADDHAGNEGPARSGRHRQVVLRRLQELVRLRRLRLLLLRLLVLRRRLRLLAAEAGGGGPERNRYTGAETA